MPIDLGIDYDAAEKESRPPIIVDGTYEFLVDHIDEGNTLEGRPSWTVWLKIVNKPEYPNRLVPYRIYFPWTDPANGQPDRSGLYLLVNFIDGIGERWTGTILPDKEVFYGKGGFMRIGHRPNRQDPEVNENTVAVVRAKRTRVSPK